MTEKHLNIAIVDDDPAIVTALSRALRMENYDITSYADGTSALRAFQIATPDAIVLDLQLPDLDGLEICRRIRRAGDDVAIMAASSTYPAMPPAARARLSSRPLAARKARTRARWTMSCAPAWSTCSPAMMMRAP